MGKQQITPAPGWPRELWCDCGYLAIDTDDLQEHTVNNPATHPSIRRGVG